RRQLLAPDVEEVAEREGDLLRRLHVDDPVAGMRVQPREAAALRHERADGRVDAAKRRTDPDAERNLPLLAADEDREVRVDVERDLLGVLVLYPLDRLAGVERLRVGEDRHLR